jgi:hypothetical protein
MIYRRAVAKLRAQDWTAIFIELMIVIVGVFVGTWVANWNEQRADKRAVQRLIEQLQPKLGQYEGVVTDDLAYYATVRGFAKTAQAGLAHDPEVSDRDLVIAAFQASELSGFNGNPFNGGTLLSVDEVRKINDPETRDRLMILESFDTELLNLLGEGSEYREKVRSIIPDEVQQGILAECGDEISPDGHHFWLRATCAAQIDPRLAASTASALRAHPELVQALTSHMAHVTRHMGAVANYGRVLRLLDERISATRR